ncbi:hypothetical protein SLS61_003079 [Didymella pomorum]
MHRSKDPVDLTADSGSDNSLFEVETPTKKAATSMTSTGEKRKRDPSWVDVLRIPKTIAAGDKGKKVIAVVAVMGEYVGCASISADLRCRVFNFDVNGQPLLNWEGGAHSKKTYDCKGLNNEDRTKLISEKENERDGRVKAQKKREMEETSI